MGLATALAQCKDWYEMLLLEYYLGDGLDDTWLCEGRYGDYDLVALRTPRQLCHEAAIMRNCVRDYGPQLGLNDCRLFSLRKGGAHLATIEIRPHPLSPDTLSVWQIRGPGNAESPDDFKKVVHRWMKTHSAANLEVPENLGAGDFHEDRWEGLWRPYVQSRGREMGKLTFIPDPKLPTRLFRLS